MVTWAGLGWNGLGREGNWATYRKEAFRGAAAAATITRLCLTNKQARQKHLPSLSPVHWHGMFLQLCVAILGRPQAYMTRLANKQAIETTTHRSSQAHSARRPTGSVN
jgi:hypothetical protein